MTTRLPSSGATENAYESKPMSQQLCSFVARWIVEADLLFGLRKLTSCLAYSS
jgi:hypothetical protein